MIFCVIDHTNALFGSELPPSPTCFRQPLDFAVCGFAPAPRKRASAERTRKSKSETVHPDSSLRFSVRNMEYGGFDAVLDHLSSGLARRPGLAQPRVVTASPELKESRTAFEPPFSIRPDLGQPRIVTARTASSRRTTQLQTPAGAVFAPAGTGLPPARS
jgi:hypothetical protein